MHRIGRVLESLLGAPHTMSPAEIEERVLVLESKVEANREALKEHERTRHPLPTEEGPIVK